MTHLEILLLTCVSAVVIVLLIGVLLASLLWFNKKLKATPAEKLAKAQAKNETRKLAIAKKQAKLDKVIADLTKAKASLVTPSK